MKQITYLNKTKNTFFYNIVSLILYFVLYILITVQFQGLYNPVIGIVLLLASICVDYYFSRKKIRIYLRFGIVILLYFVLKFLIILFSVLASPAKDYNIFIDKIPYIFSRDTFIAIFFLIFYFIFDSSKIRKHNKVLYIVSTIIIIFLYFICLRNVQPITKTIFKNYFNLFLFYIAVITLILLRHMLYHQNNVQRKFKRKDLLLFLLILLPLFLFLFVFVLQQSTSGKGNTDAGLFNQGLFQFDFSNYVELKDQIKLSDDRVLILELQGVKDTVRKQINRGWNRQIYLKRFALEEFTGNGRFKMTDQYLDPLSPPIYISGYKWEIKNKPEYKKRIDVEEIMYLINIDPSSLLGSDLITKVVPVTNWPDSPYKQIYKSYCYITDVSYSDLQFEEISQERFLKNLHKERKKLLLHWENGKEDLYIKEMADNIIAKIPEEYDNPFFRALFIQEYLRDNYFYSLTPGLGKGENQLKYFLDQSDNNPNKGYCTYFAFAMTLMLRSVGVASRVAVGFAPDMENKTMNFYDVRALHGHAWVEVYFDDYGWVTFDPTSANMAPGENFDFFFGDKEERNDLIEQILKNRDKMKEINKEKEIIDILDDIRIAVKNSIRWVGIVIFILIILFLLSIVYIKKRLHYIMYKMNPDIRKKAEFLYLDIVGRLLDLGYPIKMDEGITEYAERLKKSEVTDISYLTEIYQTAIFREKKEFEISEAGLIEERQSIMNDIKKFSNKKKILALFNISRLWRKILPVIIIVFLFSISDVFSLENMDTVSDYLIESRIAENEGYYDKAIELLDEAEERFPSSYEPNLEKGKLFYVHELYDNALTELKKAKKKGCNTEEIYQYTANSYGKIGDYNKAVQIYEEAFDNYIISINMYDKLCWMYYKIYKYNMGIDKIKEGLKIYQNSSDLLMTLGTLYSAVYDYERSKKSYQDSIIYSYEDYNSNYFRSIVYYNLSLLEKAFFEYENAYNTARASISSENRGSPHLQLNYLYMGALDLESAYDEVITASSLRPKTLFPQMSLIYIYMLAGRVDDSISLTKQLIREKDFSWMLYFGTNKEEFFAELYRDLSIGYEYKKKQINYNDKLNAVSYLTRFFKKIYYWFMSLFYNYKFANVYIKVGEEKIKGGGKLEGLTYLIDGYERIWPRKALKVLRLAKEIETAGNPKKTKIYDIREAIIRKKCSIFYTNKKKKTVLLKNLQLLDKKWEKDIIAEVLYELIKSSWGKERDKYVDLLFSHHAPYLPMNNIKAKVKITFTGDAENKKQGRKLLKYLKKRGLKQNLKSRHNIRIGFMPNNEVSVNLYEDNILKKNYIIDTSKYKKGKFYNNLSLEIFNKIFVSEIEKVN